MLNKIILLGRLTKNPEARRTATNVPVTNFTIAVDRDFSKDEVDFVDCVAWKSTAEFVERYFTKGQMICVSGRLQSRKWTDKEENLHTTWEVVAENVYFGGDKKTESREPKPTRVEASGFEELPDDNSELPF